MAENLSLERPTLFVEGEDDAHAIIHLLARHGIELDRKAGPVYVQATGNDTQLLKAVGLAAKAATTSTVGFVIDIDTSAAGRWDAVRNKLVPLGIDLADKAPAHGLAINAPGSRRIGAWLMADNETDGGCLETLLDQLIIQGNPLRPYAEIASDEAKKNHSAPYPPKYRMKAIMRTWLAWQAEPGIAYGNAIRAGWLSTEHDLVRRFVEWFKTLYGAHLAP